MKGKHTSPAEMKASSAGSTLENRQGSEDAEDTTVDLESRRER